MKGKLSDIYKGTINEGNRNVLVHLKTKEQIKRGKLKKDKKKRQKNFRVLSGSCDPQ